MEVTPCTYFLRVIQKGYGICISRDIGFDFHAFRIDVLCSLSVTELWKVRGKDIF